MSTSSPSSPIVPPIKLDCHGSKSSPLKNNKSEVPYSPTDDMMSPCSARILRGKKASKRKMNTIEFDRVKHLDNSVTALENIPCPTKLPIILGSSSRFRKSVLERHGWLFTTMSPDIDEKAIRCEDPLELPVKIAIAKANALLERFDSTSNPSILITADQVVLFKGVVREKPINAEEAQAFLSSYSNSSVSTVSAVVATCIPSRKQASAVDISTVHWSTISQETVDKVLARGVVYSTAGGFVIEDDDLQHLVVSIDGSKDSVQGLPMKCLVDVITKALDETPSAAADDDEIVG